MISQSEEQTAAANDLAYKSKILRFANLINA